MTTYGQKKISQAKAALLNHASQTPKTPVRESSRVNSRRRQVEGQHSVERKETSSIAECRRAWLQTRQGKTQTQSHGILKIPVDFLAPYRMFAVAIKPLNRIVL
jgi:hypothetical protein